MAIAEVQAPATTAASRDARAPVSGDLMWAIAFVAPYFIVFALFVVYPVLYGIWLGSNPASYRRVIQDPAFTYSLANTAIFLLLAVNVKMILALLLSGFFLREERWVRWLSVLFVLAWAMPSIPTILSFRWMFNPEWGVINETLWRWFQIEGPNWLTERHYGLMLAIIVHIWKSLPFWTLILLAARMAIPKDLYEAAQMDHASPWRTFSRITLPLLMPNLLVVCVLALIRAVQIFDEVFVLTGGGPGSATTFIVQFIYQTGFMEQIRLYGMAAAGSLVLAAALIVLTLVQLRIANAEKNEGPAR